MHPLHTYTLTSYHTPTIIDHLSIRHPFCAIYIYFILSTHFLWQSPTILIIKNFFLSTLFLKSTIARTRFTLNAISYNTFSLNPHLLSKYSLQTKDPLPTKFQLSTNNKLFPKYFLSSILPISSFF